MVQNGGSQKAKKGKVLKNRTKEGLRTRVRTSDTTNSPAGQPSLYTAGSGGRDKCTKRGGLGLEGLRPFFAF